MNVIKPCSVDIKPIVIAQISDSHLFSSPNGLHHGHNVLTNLKKVLQSIRNTPTIDYVVFTGDLTQDHTEQSYQNFVDCVHELDVTVPIYYLAGNHDEPELLAKYFSAAPFFADKEIDLLNWQIQLIDSKSSTPAGYVSEQALTHLQSTIKPSKYQLVMMHHHPIDVGYFIDQHGLQNKTDFWQVITAYNNIKAIACGHVHSAMQISYPIAKPLIQPLTQSLSQPISPKSTNTKEAITLYTCPATSIQFDPNVDGVAALAKGPGYRIFYLHADGQLNTDVVML